MSRRKMEVNGDGEDLGDDEVVDIVTAKAIADGRGFQQDFVFP